MALFTQLFQKTYTQILDVTSTNGFHLRPAAQFVAEAKKFDCSVEATLQGELSSGKVVNAKAVNALLSLNLAKDDTFTLLTKGKDAQKALETLTKVFQQLMQNEKIVKPIEQINQTHEGENIEGLILVQGVAIAPLHHYVEKESYLDNGMAFQDALHNALNELETLSKTSPSKEEGEICMAQKELLDSVSKLVGTFKVFEERIDKEIKRLKDTANESKIFDFLDLKRRVKKHLGYTYHVALPKTPFILSAHILLPSDIIVLEKSQVQGVILHNTTPTSHTAILLRGIGVPSLISNDDIRTHDETVILDASAGVLVTHPTKEDIKNATKRLRIQQNRQIEIHEKRSHHAHTKAKKRIFVLANVIDIPSAKIAKEEGAEGIGLLRTEFLFGQQEPTVLEQSTAYKHIFSLFSNITVRTLDVGGDKALPYVKLPKEENPFLGIRGIRLFKTHPQLIEDQLYAIFLASQERALKVMFPMVSTVEEFNEAKQFAQNVAKKYKLNISHIQFGIMIEVPSVLFLLEQFNKVVDFYSIGTNDLTQYIYAIERTHPTLVADATSPLMYDILQNIIQQSTKPVSLCGELASDSNAIETLVDLGLETLSVSPKLIAQTKESIRYV